MPCPHKLSEKRNSLSNWPNSDQATAQDAKSWWTLVVDAA